MSREEVSRKLAQLLDELTEGEVHCVVLAAAAGHENKSIGFGMETNTKKDVATALLRAGMKRLDSMQTDDAPRDNSRTEHPKH